MCGKLYLLILTMCLLKDASGNPVPCLSANRNLFYPYTGTKTPYSYVHNDTGRTMIPTNCKPTQIWMLSRHGTRYPDMFKIAQILNLTHIQNRIISDGRNETCIHVPPYVKKGLTNWKPFPELVPRKAMYLAMQGEKDLTSLAKRLGAKLPLLFGGSVTKRFKFRSTATQRTIASMKAFIKGALDISLEIAPIVNDTWSQFKSMNVQQTATIKTSEGAFSNASFELEVVPRANDTLLKLYDTCESWKSMDVKKEVDAFINGPEITKVWTTVSWRLGLSNISKEDVLLFYDTCRFERALHLNESSAWCDIFTDDEMRVLEYENDLSSYYRAGPGQEINSKLGCYTIRDMLDHFAKLEVDGNDEPTGVFYFTHSHMVMIFLTTMGIGKGSVPLTAANFREMDRRTWRSSLLFPFAANFVAVFHRCDSSDTSSKIAFYLNENPLILEGCENGICDWAQLKKKLSAIAAECNAKICQKKMWQKMSKST